MRIRTIIAAACGAILAVLLGVGAGEASAAPITCPGGQTAVQVSPSEWQCVNNGGNANNSETPRSPQADKNTF